MQTVSTQFSELASGHVRPLSWKVSASFDKSFDPTVGFFTLDSSLLDGPDILSPDSSNVVTEWDKYAYTDYSERVISVEVNREETQPYSIVRAFADVTLNNFDNYFTPNSGSPIDAFILPKRPFRISMGFNGENIPMFVGLSEKLPEIDLKARTARFHLIDFLSFIMDKEVGNTAMLEGYSTSEILAYLFAQIGLLSDQYDLEPSFNRIPYFFVEKGTTLGYVIRELMIAEQGRLYMDEFGIIRFKNRQSYPTIPVWTFDRDNVLDYRPSTEDFIINSVKLTSDILAEQQTQSIWQLAEPVSVSAGASVDIWASLSNPITAVTTPTYSEVDVEASHYISTADSAGATLYPGISVSSITPFSKSVKITFNNSGGTNGYVYAIDLWGTPIKVQDTIRVEDTDPTSIGKYEERVYELTTPYIQTRDNAVSKAAILLDDYKELGSIIELQVKGNMALQIGDLVDLSVDGYIGEYVITKKQDILSGRRFNQYLTCRFKIPREYFILDSSLLDGVAVLTP